MIAAFIASLLLATEKGRWCVIITGGFLFRFLLWSITNGVLFLLAAVVYLGLKK